MDDKETPTAGWHGCQNCGEEICPWKIDNMLICPECGSQDLVSLEDEDTAE